jgi:membrane protease YdiL (CAAX protease family)
MSQDELTLKPQPRRHALLLGLGFEGGLAAVAWALGWLLGQSPLERFAWDWWDFAIGVGVCLPLFGLFLLGQRSQWGPLARIKQFLDDFIKPFFAASTVLDLALISLAAGIGEEMLFRGVLQAAVGNWLGPWVGLVVASVLFGLAHLITPTYAVLAALIGAYLGWLWMLTDNLLVVIVAHALYDFLALLYILRGERLASSD